MASITLTFTKTLNVSVQEGDTAYYTNDINGDSIIEIGEITNVTSKSITVTIAANAPRPTSSSFILFSKTNEANISGILGYYAEVTFKNKSTKKAELFSIATEIFESSK